MEGLAISSPSSGNWARIHPLLPPWRVCRERLRTGLSARSTEIEPTGLAVSKNLVLVGTLSYVCVCVNVGHVKHPLRLFTLRRRDLVVVMFAVDVFKPASD